MMGLSRRGFLQAASGLAISIGLPQPPYSPDEGTGIAMGAGPAIPRGPEASPSDGVSTEPWCEELVERIRHHSVMTKVCHVLQWPETRVVEPVLDSRVMALVLDYSTQFAFLDDTAHLDNCARQLALYIDGAGFDRLMEQKALSLHKAWQNGPTLSGQHIIGAHDAKSFMLEIFEAMDDGNLPDAGRWVTVPHWLWDLLLDDLESEHKGLHLCTWMMINRVFVCPSAVLDASSHELSSDVFFGGASFGACIASVRDAETLRIEDQSKSLCHGFLVFGAQVTDPRMLGHVRVRRTEDG